MKRSRGEKENGGDISTRIPSWDGHRVGIPKFESGSH
jgi:hypothetical protein